MARVLYDGVRDQERTLDRPTRLPAWTGCLSFLVFGSWSLVWSCLEISRVLQKFLAVMSAGNLKGGRRRQNRSGGRVVGLELTISAASGCTRRREGEREREVLAGAVPVGGASTMSGVFIDAGVLGKRLEQIYRSWTDQVRSSGPCPCRARIRVRSSPASTPGPPD